MNFLLRDMPLKMDEVQLSSKADRSVFLTSKVLTDLGKERNSFHEFFKKVSIENAAQIDEKTNNIFVEYLDKLLDFSQGIDKIKSFPLNFQYSLFLRSQIGSDRFEVNGSSFYPSKQV